MSQKSDTLRKLKQFHVNGVTVATFPTGWRLASRIHELVHIDKLPITSTMEYGKNGKKWARYRLVNKPTRSRQQER
jgi:hypothetical protein